MVEFGEKVKHFREEKGMTQQTMAEKLYVTRQAVSRWECGARYPDLLTAKKISRILEVSLDELMSGEELKEKIEKEPVLAQPVENIMQTVLYAVVVMVYLLLCIFSLYSILNEALAGTPAGKIFSITSVSLDMTRVIHLAAAVTGFVLSVKNKLTAKATGYIMCVPYLLSSLSFLALIVDIQIHKNGHIDIYGWLEDFVAPLLFAACIILFFTLRERRIPFVAILAICILTVGYLAYGYRHRLMYATDLGFVVTTVHMAGKIGMSVLLGYQAYVWDKKKKIAYELK